MRIILLLCCLLLASTFQSVGAQQRRPAILFVASPSGVVNQVGYHTAKALDEAGFNVAFLGNKEPVLTWDIVKNYNAIALLGMGNANADGSLTQINLQNREILQRFTAAGGGILYVPMWLQQKTLIPPQLDWAKSVGLTPLIDEMPQDEASKVQATAWDIDFAYTENITASPITQGVKALWYPVPSTRIGAQTHSVPLQVDENWTVVVKGAASSSTKKVPLETMQATAQLPGTIDSAVPLAATRQNGKGRIVALGISLDYLFGPHAATTLENIVLERGLNDKPSTGLKLLVNAFTWLTQPSLAQTTLGGAPTEQNLLVNPLQTKFAPPLDWKQASFPPVNQAYLGVIGARTLYSTGHANAAQWVEKAKASGLSYLVFLEEFGSLSPESFRKLKDDCRQLSSPTFTAVPGFTIDDELGNHYFYIGMDVPYPDKKLLSKDGKVFVSYDPEVSPTDPHLKGQLNSTILDYAYTTAGFKLTAGNFLFRQSAAPFANFYGNWTSTGVITSRNGALIEDATKEFLELVEAGQAPVPLAIDLMDETAQLDKASWRTVLNLPASGDLIEGKLRPASKLADFWSLWHFFPNNPVTISISSGPQIENWSRSGGRDYEGDTPGDFVWQNYRWQVRGKVSSAVGLKEVAIFDGTKPFRRFQPQGAKEFDFTLDLTHNQQHNLVLITTDTAGGKAISGEQWDRNHRLEETQCSDRNNQLSYGYNTRPDGQGIQMGGNQALSAPNKRVDLNSYSPSGVYKNDPLLGAPAFDGIAYGEPDITLPIQMYNKDWTPAAPDVCRAQRLLHSGDVNIGQASWEHKFTDNIRVFNVWHTLWKSEPAPDFAFSRQSQWFQIDPASPLTVSLWRMKVTLQRDVDGNGFYIGSLRTAKDKRWAIRGSNGTIKSALWSDQSPVGIQPIEMPFGRGSYAALLDSPLGGAALFPLTDGLNVSLNLPKKQPMLFRMSKADSPETKGQTKEIDVLMLGIPRLTDATKELAADSLATVERFSRDFGLGNAPPAYTVKPLTGTVADQRYVLHLDGATANCFSGKLTGNLITTLPITVSNLNAGWSSYLYDRKLQKARPLGMQAGAAWATIVLKGEVDLFIGQPVTCDQPEVQIQVTQTGDKSWRVEAHNPTDRALPVTLQANPHFDPLKTAPKKTIQLPAGGSVWFDL